MLLRSVTRIFISVQNSCKNFSFSASDRVVPNKSTFVSVYRNCSDLLVAITKVFITFKGLLCSRIFKAVPISVLITRALEFKFVFHRRKMEKTIVTVH